MPAWPHRQPLIAFGALGALIALIALIALLLAGNYIHREILTAPTDRVLVAERGSGPGGQTTEVFTADGDWNLYWSYDCSSSLGNQYPSHDQCDFFLTVKQFSDCLVSQQNQGISRRSAKPDHGVAHYHTGGTFYFVVDAYGSWTFTVTGPGQASGMGPASRCSEG